MVIIKTPINFIGFGVEYRTQKKSVTCSRLQWWIQRFSNEIQAIILSPWIRHWLSTRTHTCVFKLLSCKEMDALHTDETFFAYSAIYRQENRYRNTVNYISCHKKNVRQIRRTFLIILDMSLF